MHQTSNEFQPKDKSPVPTLKLGLAIKKDTSVSGRLPKLSGRGPLVSGRKKSPKDEEPAGLVMIDTTQSNRNTTTVVDNLRNQDRLPLPPEE